MNEQRFVLIREVTVQECPWLESNLPEGTHVWSYNGVTYGCISDKGRAFTIEPGEDPFFELPINAVQLYV